MDALKLRRSMESGVLSFPVTHFGPDLKFDQDAYSEHVSWLAGHGPGALFAAGGTGEMFSLTPAEIVDVVAAAKRAAGQVPIIAGVGYGTALAVEIARSVERAGADGILLLPHYLIGAEQEGMFEHVRCVCQAVGIGVFVYSRDYSRFAPATMERLAESCPNLVGFKDGTGDIETITAIVARLGDRLIYVGGMPTHEVYATAYHGAGMRNYSSAVFNFVPHIATEFYAAVQRRDLDTTTRILRDFFLPLIAIRDRKKGYAVSMVKAGLRVIGRDPGPVRPPLVDFDEVELEMLRKLVDRNGPPRLHGNGSIQERAVVGSFS